MKIIDTWRSDGKKWIPLGKIELFFLLGLILIIVVGIFVIAQQEEPEVTENVTYTDYQTNTVDLGNRTFAQTSYLGYVNYYNGSEFMPINTTIVESSDQLFDYEVVEGVYQAYFKSDPTHGQVVKFIKDGIEITFQPMGLLYEGYYGGLEQISMIQDVVGVPNESMFLYKNAYGNGIDLRYSYYNELLKENLIISQSSDLPPPPQYMIDQGNITLNLDFVLETDSNHIVIEGVEWDKKSDKTTSNEVYIKNESGDIVYYLPVPYAYDSYDSSQLLEYQFTRQGGSLYITIKTPYSWLNDSSRVYPVYIDPSVGPQSAGLGENIDNLWGVRDWYGVTNIYTSNNVYSDVSLDGPYDEEDGESSHYLRATHFDFTTIPDGATIDGIVVEFEKKSAAGFIEDDHVYIVKTGTEQGDNKALGFWSTTESYVSYGGATDKWGLTWTQDQINSTNFGVSINCYNSEYDESDTAYVDHVRITVYYTGVGPSNFYINVGDTWQDAEAIYVNVGDVWEDVEAVYVNVGDVWQQIF